MEYTEEMGAKDPNKTLQHALKQETKKILARDSRKQTERFNKSFAIAGRQFFQGPEVFVMYFAEIMNGNVPKIHPDESEESGWRMEVDTENVEVVSLETRMAAAKILKDAIFGMPIQSIQMEASLRQHLGDDTRTLAQSLASKPELAVSLLSLLRAAKNGNPGPAVLDVPSSEEDNIEADPEVKTTST